MFNIIVKYLLFIFNLIFVIVGAAIIAVGTIIHLKLDVITENIPENVNLYNFNLLPIFIIVIGCIIFLIAFSGCCGAITESKCLLITYACIMLILAAAKIYIVVTLFNNMGAYRGKIETFVDKTFADPSSNATFHAMEHTLKCCGTHGSGSYYGILEHLPPTCCEGVLETCLSDGGNSIVSCSCDKDYAYEEGCRAVLGDYFEKFSNYIGYGFIAVIIIEIVAMVCAVYFAKTIRIQKY